MLLETPSPLTFTTYGEICQDALSSVIGKLGQLLHRRDGIVAYFCENNSCNRKYENYGWGQASHRHLILEFCFHDKMIKTISDPKWKLRISSEKADKEIK